MLSKVYLQENKNVNITLADDLAMQGARSSAGMISIKILWNTVFPAWKKLSKIEALIIIIQLYTSGELSFHTSTC